MRLALIGCAALLTLVSHVAADAPPETVEKYDCAYGCWMALAQAKWTDMSSKAKTGDTAACCGSDGFMTSLVLCSQTYCSPKVMQPGWDYVTSLCGAKKVGVKVGTLESWEAKVEDARDVQVVNTLTIGKGEANGTILLAQEAWKIGRDTVVARDLSYAWSHRFGWTMYSLFGFAILTGTLLRVYRKLATHLAIKYRDTAQQAAYDPAKSLSLVGKAHAFYMRHIFVPGAFGYHRATAWRWFSIPTRLQALWVLLYVAINVVFLASHYMIFPEYLSQPNDTLGVHVRFVADRAAILAIYNLPLLWCLGGRNDVFIWLSGWSFATMNLLHRWMGRMTVAHILIHMSGYFWRHVRTGKIKSNWGQRYYRAGIFAMMCFVLIIPLAMLPVRKRAYEFFLLAHITLALTALVLVRYHIEKYDDQYPGFVWACITVWGFDRVVRIARVAVLSFRTFQPFKRAKAHNSLGRLSSAPSGLIRLSITTSVPVRPRAGEYYFLYFPTWYNFWENHPFTLASWDTVPVQPDKETNNNGGGSGKNKKQTRLHFLVAPQRGATSRLYRKLERAERRLASDFQGEIGQIQRGSQSAGVPFRVLVEGPYGTRHDLRPYHSLVFIAGGSGITAILPYLYDLTRASASAGGTSSGTTITVAVAKHRGLVDRVTVVWGVKDLAYAADVLEGELREWPDWVQVRVYLSTKRDEAALNVIEGLQPSSSSSASSSSSSSASASEVPIGTPATATIATPTMEKAQSVVPSTSESPGLSTVAELEKGNGAMSGVQTAVPSPEGSMSDVQLDEKQPYPAPPPQRGHEPAEKQEAQVARGHRYHPHLVVRHGRPKMDAILRESIADLRGRERLGVMTCGPAGMMDDLRHAVSRSYGSGDGQLGADRLTYFEDAFGW